jgi:hypothetical protein
LKVGNEEAKEEVDVEEVVYEMKETSTPDTPIDLDEYF